jgi:hypothetical protein
MKGRLQPTLVVCVALGFLLGAVITVQTQSQSQSQEPQPAPAGLANSQYAHLLDTRPDSGQTVAPVFEGWEPNPDGTASMYFGYMNRNWKETLDIPIGPNNHFSPGAQDRGQPTHFLPRRRKQTFAIVVPRDYKDTIVWTLTIRGKTEKVPGSLKPEQQVDVSKDTSDNNTPPKISVPAQLTAVVRQPLKLTAAVADDGLPKPRGARAGNPLAGLNVSWSKYRGPGSIAFSTVVTPVAGGSAATEATFAQPGVYVVQALADDGSILATSQGQNVPGYACCWSTANITVTVKATAAGSAQ